ncbi:uncharacterized protein KY384_004848 [Bacidia gigantensis]|uniref:uncharacterized protein n=1 Tax=Bacidia gigantensis TaxID=2732470 RepID=UPI001D04109A|nr:uncharacterized protein KY384_004848 [Bacidia gigantensis]KAG8530346.1 hypothetical protein KY384_004848 [Bacidia gigantensis]
MPSWREEYLGGLRQRDKHEKANEALYTNARIADKTAALQAQLAAKPEPVPQPSSTPKLGDRKASQNAKIPSASPTQPDVLAKLRQDLSEAQRSRGLLESKLQSTSDEFQKLVIQSSLDTKRIAELKRESDALTRSVKDRREEIKGKAKLLEDVHDETVSLTLQLNLADQRASRLEKENKELVERWMRRMGEEADKMNENSKFS